MRSWITTSTNDSMFRITSIHLFIVSIILIELSTAIYAQSCIYTISNSSGVILSPNYGNGTYDNNLSCLWYLQPPNSSYTYVTVSFTTFNTEPGNDYFIIHDGPSNTSDVILRFTGNTTLPFQTSSTQPYMTLEFTSDASIGGLGWNLTYTFKTNRPPICSGTREIPMNSGNISQIVNFTSGASGTLECRWEIDPYIPTSGGQRYTMGDFVLSQFSDTSDSLLIRVYNGTSTSGSVLASFTNQTTLNSPVETNLTFFGSTLIRVTVSQTPNGNYSFEMMFNISSVLIPSPSPTSSPSHNSSPSPSRSRSPSTSPSRTPSKTPSPSKTPHSTNNNNNHHGGKSKSSTEGLMTVLPIIGIVVAVLLVLGGVAVCVSMWRQHQKAKNGGEMNSVTMAGLARNPEFSLK